MFAKQDDKFKKYLSFSGKLLFDTMEGQEDIDLFE